MQPLRPVDPRCLAWLRPEGVALRDLEAARERIAPHPALRALWGRLRGPDGLRSR